jgi:hypothetical protein
MGTTFFKIVIFRVLYLTKNQKVSLSVEVFV